MATSRYNTEYRPFEAGSDLPKVSTSLDSVRAYQFEVQFFGLPPAVSTQQTDLTLAAKVVGPVGMSVENIAVRRVNDQMFYPGYANQEDLTVTFDNLYLRRTSEALWSWFKSIYDPITGAQTAVAAPGGPGNNTFKANKLRIVQLDNTRTPHAAIELYGVYPSMVRFAEHNYSTNDFHTLEVTFKHDFMDYYKY